MGNVTLMHYQRADGKTVCGRGIYITTRLTADVTKITCRVCKASPYLDDQLANWSA